MKDYNDLELEQAHILTGENGSIKVVYKTANCLSLETEQEVCRIATEKHGTMVAIITDQIGFGEAVMTFIFCFPEHIHAAGFCCSPKLKYIMEHGEPLPVGDEGRADPYAMTYRDIWDEDGKEELGT